jgi:hypothetical protein
MHVEIAKDLKTQGDISAEGEVHGYFIANYKLRGKT